MKTRNNALLVLLLSVCLIVCFVFCIQQVFAEPKREIIFDSFVDVANKKPMPELDFSSYSSVEGEMFYVTRQPGYYDNSQEIVKLEEGYYSNGMITTEMDRHFVNIDNIISPIIYIEDHIDNNVKCSLYQETLLFNDNSISFYIDKESENVKRTEENGIKSLVIKYYVSNPSFFPSEMVLVNNNEEYLITAGQHNFSDESGDFTKGYIVFEGIDSKELSETAYISVHSVMQKYTCEDVFVR